MQQETHTHPHTQPVNEHHKVIHFHNYSEINSHSKSKFIVIANNFISPINFTKYNYLNGTKISIKEKQVNIKEHNDLIHFFVIYNIK